jgi:hypothetical protein
LRGLEEAEFRVNDLLPALKGLEHAGEEEEEFNVNDLLPPLPALPFPIP